MTNPIDLCHCRQELTSAAHALERESFAKCGKSSREVYKSQALGLMRWAAAATREQLRERLGPLPEASGGAAGVSGSASGTVPGSEGHWQTAAALSGQKRKLDGGSVAESVAGRNAVEVSEQRGISLYGTGLAPAPQPPAILSFDEFREREKLQRKTANVQKQ